MFFFLLGGKCGAVLEPAPGQSNCGSAISGEMLISIGQKGDLIFLSLDWRGFSLISPTKACLEDHSFSLVTLDLTSLKPDWLFFLICDWMFFLIGHALSYLTETILVVLSHWSRLTLPYWNHTGCAFSLVTPYLTLLKPYWLCFLIGHALSYRTETRLVVLSQWSCLSLPYWKRDWLVFLIGPCILSFGRHSHHIVLIPKNNF